MGFQETDIHSLEFNPFDKISKQWMLVTAGDEEGSNTMTASWGGLGVMWGKPVSFIVVRPTRYTFEFIENSEFYTLCFFEESYRQVLNYCGKYSGRDVDKIKENKLTVCEEQGVPYFEEAKLVLVCKKRYGQNFDLESFTEPAFGDSMYPDRNIHKMFIGEIQKVLVAQ